MKKIIYSLLFVAEMHTGFAQKPNVDSILQKVAVEKDEDKTAELLLSLLTFELNNNPAWTIKIGSKLLDQSKRLNSDIEKSFGYSFLGQGYRLLGNYIRALDYHHSAIVLAEKSGNLSMLAFAENQLGHVYKDREEYQKAISLYLSSSTHAEKGKNESVKGWGPCNLGASYLAINDLDSSLMYSQRAYEIFLRHKITFILPYIYINLGGVQSKMGNAPLAVSYLKMAISECSGTANVRYLNQAYIGLAEHFCRLDQEDSCTFYAKKANNVVKNTAFSYLSSKPAQILAGIYLNKNCDSALKYVEVSKTAADSLTSRKANQQILLMTFEEDQRQRETAAEKLRGEHQRKQNIQYALIALGIISSIIIFLLLSRSFITNTKVIEFFSVIALLIVFEFLNLLLHPFLEAVTDHSPLLMLLALVCIATMLVPLHHKLEKWAKTKLVEKNKKIRLAEAKRTIQQLDIQAEDKSI